MVWHCLTQSLSSTITAAASSRAFALLVLLLSLRLPFTEAPGNRQQFSEVVRFRFFLATPHDANRTFTQKEERPWLL